MTDPKEYPHPIRHGVERQPIVKDGGQVPIHPGHKPTDAAMRTKDACLPTKSK